MKNLFVTKHKGANSLIMSLISIGVMAVVAYGVALMHELNYDSIHSAHVKAQASQYALDRANIIRSMDYSTVTEMVKTEIPNSSSTGSDNDAYFEEVLQDYVDGDQYKEYRVNIYIGVKSSDVVASTIVRHTNPGYLLDGQIVGVTEDSEKSSLSSSAAHEIADGRFSEGVGSDSSINAMSASALKEYVTITLNQYISSNEAVKWVSGQAVGNNVVPIYVADKGYATAGAVSNRMDVNTKGSWIAVLVYENNHYYIDYLAKSDFFKY